MSFVRTCAPNLMYARIHTQVLHCSQYSGGYTFSWQVCSALSAVWCALQVYLDKSHMDGVDELFEDKLPWSHIENGVPVSQLRNVHDPAHYPIPCDV